MDKFTQFVHQKKLEYALGSSTNWGIFVLIPFPSLNRINLSNSHGIVPLINLVVTMDAALNHSSLCFTFSSFLLYSFLFFSS
ncbi:hypothetical protein PFISCL1PPCAC_15242, partial [Pristionchus fissidentatus]